MPRQARRHSQSGIYHIMLRGNEKKAIFKDAEDKNKFLELVQPKTRETGTKIYAYCVMSNHAHLLLREGSETLESVMKRIGVAYAQYYNQKHERVGHVFQDRFRSEAVEGERYLYAVIRYIHNNPVKAGDLRGLHYPWSSYLYYIDRRKRQKWPEIEEIMDMFSENREQAVRLFITFQAKEDPDAFLEDSPAVCSREEAKDLATRYLEKGQWTSEKLMRPDQAPVAGELLRKLQLETGFSARKIADLLGIGRERTRCLLKTK